MSERTEARKTVEMRNSQDDNVHDGNGVSMDLGKNL